MSLRDEFTASMRRQGREVPAAPYEPTREPYRLPERGPPLDNVGHGKRTRPCSCGCGADVVSRRPLGADVRTVECRRRAMPTQAEVRALRASGLTWAAVGERIGRSDTQAKQIATGRG